MQTEPTVPFSPSPFGKFFLLRRLALGGMAEICIAAPLDAASDAPLWVIKKLRSRYASNKTFVEMLIDEAKILSLLDHPNILKVFDLGSAADSFYLQLEWVRGVSLDRLIAKLNSLGQKIPPPLALAILRLACAGLAAVHGASDGAGRPLKLIHRDLTPGNFLLGYDGTLKLCDFGIATAAKERRELPRELTFGKLPYMSPEQLARQGVGQASDLYSLGVVFYELLHGEKLFSGKSELELQNKVQQGVPSPLPWPRNDLPAAWREGLARLLSRDPAQRPANPLAAPLLFPEVAAAEAKALADFLTNLFAAEIAAEGKSLAAARRRQAAASAAAPSETVESSAPAGKTEIQPQPAEQATAFVPLAKLDLEKIQRQAEAMRRQAVASLAIEEASPSLDLLSAEPGAMATPPLPEGGASDLSSFQEVSLPQAAAGEKTELFAHGEMEETTGPREAVPYDPHEIAIDPQAATWLEEPAAQEAASIPAPEPAPLERVSPPAAPPARPVAPEIPGTAPATPRPSSPLPPPAPTTLPAATPARAPLEPTVEYKPPSRPPASRPQPSAPRPQPAADLGTPEQEERTSFMARLFSRPRLQKAKLALFLAAAAIALGALVKMSLLVFTTGVEPRPWPPQRAAEVELRFYRLRGEWSGEEQKFLRALLQGGDPRLNTIKDLERLFQRERQRLTGNAELPLHLTVSEIEEIPAPPPAQDSWLGTASVSNFFERLAAGTKDRQTDAAVHIYLYPVDPLGVTQYPLEFQGRRRSGQGVVFIPANRGDLNYSLLMIAHEIALLFGAHNKYDGANQPLYPEGYVAPQKTPLYPQEKAELMAKVIPLSASQFLAIARLEEVGIGEMTARELGWLSGETNAQTSPP